MNVGEVIIAADRCYEGCVFIRARGRVCMCVCVCGNKLPVIPAIRHL